MKIADISVELLDFMGDDLTVVNAARVSFDKESEWDWVEDQVATILSQKDQKLIQYLARHGHFTPFTHVFASFRIKAPIFVARQLQKHQVGLAWNEVSRRYVDSEPEFYMPKAWRKRAENVKQGSSEETITKYPQYENENDIREAVLSRMQGCLYEYEDLIDAGVCPEQARMVLPQSTMTEWWWSGSLAAFARVYKLRTDPHAQQETREVALKIGELIAPIAPHSWNALTVRQINADD